MLKQNTQKALVVLSGGQDLFARRIARIPQGLTSSIISLLHVLIAPELDHDQRVSVI